MIDTFLIKLFEHNNWANLKTIQACSILTDEQLDSEPRSATKGSIRRTLVHLLTSQRGYLSLLTMPVGTRPTTPIPFSELREVARVSGEGFLSMLRDVAENPVTSLIQTSDGFFVEPWVVMVQIINHATEHREQINSMLSALGVTPPELDGWAYGEATKALVPMSG